MSKAGSSMPWSMPVSLVDVPEIGRHFDLVADARVRSAVAELAGLAALPRLDASFSVTLHGRDGLHVVGRVSATVHQTCVVTLEPLENEVVEPIDLVFTPAALPPVGAGIGADVEMPTDDEPEPLVNGVVDLGTLATEFLLLGVDPYPRKLGAVFEAPATKDELTGPFASLTALHEAQRKWPRNQD